MEDVSRLEVILGAATILLGGGAAYGWRWAAAALRAVKLLMTVVQKAREGHASTPEAYAYDVTAAKLGGNLIKDTTAEEMKEEKPLVQAIIQNTADVIKGRAKKRILGRLLGL